MQRLTSLEEEKLSLEEKVAELTMQLKEAQVYCVYLHVVELTPYIMQYNTVC